MIPTASSNVVVGEECSSIVLVAACLEWVLSLALAQTPPPSTAVERGGGGS